MRGNVGRNSGLRDSNGTEVRVCSGREGVKRADNGGEKEEWRGVVVAGPKKGKAEGD